MELDGLRAWIGLIEQKLGKRTRVFLVLVAIAVGGAGAAVYLAIDANDAAVSKADLEATRNELAGQGAGGGGAELSQLEAEVAQLKSEVEALNNGSAPQGNGSGGGQDGGSGSAPGGGTSGAQPPKRTPKELLEALKERAQQQ